MASLNGSFLNLTRLCSINAEVLNQKLLFLSMIRYGACQNGRSLKNHWIFEKKKFTKCFRRVKKGFYCLWSMAICELPRFKITITQSSFLFSTCLSWISVDLESWNVGNSQTYQFYNITVLKLNFITSLRHFLLRFYLNLNLFMNSQG